MSCLASELGMLLKLLVSPSSFMSPVNFVDIYPAFPSPSEVELFWR